ncbi:MAG: IS66 family transposase [Rikenellaceae bacterium]
MNYKELAERLAKTIEIMSGSIATLTAEVAQLKALLLEKDKSLEAKAAQLNGLTKIALPKKNEKVKRYVDTTLTEKTPAPTPKERGNNGAKRKVYQVEELEVINVEPDDEIFKAQKADAVFLFSREVVRYKYIPPRLVKQIYSCRKYRLGDNLYEGKAPIAPLLNSNFDSSIIANIIQQRFVYGLPVERIVKQYNEMGIDMPKATAHGLLTKVGEMLDRLDPILKEAILSDEYLHFDETHHTILDKSKSGGSFKGYFWAALSQRLGLMHIFISEGSRAKAVFTKYLPHSYRGAVQSDGYSSYKVVEGWDYPSAIRLGCVQHCKRKFLEIEEQSEAKEIIGIYNEFYRIRHNNPKEEWVERSAEVIERLERRLRELERDKDSLGNAALSGAVAYSLNELEAVRNIVSSTEYELDNNAIERPMRYISTSRKNSMFAGSMRGAKRMALIYSLAISCRLNGVNSFAYFCDVINRLAELSPSTSQEKLRELLPDKWKFSKL